MVVGFRFDTTAVLTTVRLAWRFSRGCGFPVLVDMPFNSVQDSRTKVVQIANSRLDNGGIAIEAIEHAHTAWTYETDHP